MVWEIADDVLTTTVIGGIGENLTVDLTQYTIGTLASFLASQPGYLVPYLDQTGYAGLGAIALVEGGNDIATSNGDHIYVATNPTYALMSAYSTELMLARIAIQASPAEMATTTADGEWLDLLGSYYAVPRQLGEFDGVYGPRIPAEVILPRQNNLAIEIALQVATGQPAICTDAIVYGDPLPIFDGAIAFSGAPHFFNASAARIFNLFDVQIGYALTGNQTPAQFLFSVRGQVDRLRAAGTHLRLLTLGPSIMGDTAPQPTDALSEVLSVTTYFASGPTVVSADFATADFGTWLAVATSTDSGLGTLVTGSISNTASLAGAGSMTGQPILRQAARATLAGAGTATIASKVTATAAMTGAGAFAANALTPQQYAQSAPLAGTGAFLGSATHTPQALAVMAGASTMSGNAAVRLNPLVSAALAGAGSLTADGRARMVASASLGGAGAMSGSVIGDTPFSAEFSVEFAGGSRGIVIATASLAGAGGALAAPSAWMLASAALNGAGTALGFATVNKAFGATLTGTGAMVGNATVLLGVGTAPFSSSFSIEFLGGTLSGRFAVGSMSGAGGFSAAPVARAAATAALNGAGTAIVFSTVNKAFGATLTGSGAIFGNATVLAGVGATAPFSADFSADFPGGTTVGQRFGASVLNGAGALISSATIRLPGLATLVGSGTVAADGVPVRVFGATVAGAGAMSGNATVSVAGSAASPWSGDFSIEFTGAPAHQVSGAGVMAGSGAFGAGTVARAAALAALSGAGSATISSAVFRTAAAAAMAGAGGMAATTSIASTPIPGSPWSVDFSNVFGPIGSGNSLVITATLGGGGGVVARAITRQAVQATLSGAGGFTTGNQLVLRAARATLNGFGLAISSATGSAGGSPWGADFNDRFGR